MKTKPFSELRKQMTPERRAKNKTRAQLMSLHLTLLELQQSLGLTQDEIEIDFNNFEATISELDNQEDIQVSTLSRYIKALGGNLKIVAHFPNEEITLAQFE
ncbi:transcriptional regulator [Anabaena sp. UHCC 0253]|uniref:XRE family transcriptional regulator n=1 Tax=Anabaena sp. UHCC 0253 TaxID=2590019 RepID=UPI001447027D|nr:XRE family transcriptional regulator [Anabaena sp. UHCC 0253]MTJ51682.1 transcriptional regulator [Anabaena sp. UHCC 0253]